MSNVEANENLKGVNSIALAVIPEVRRKFLLLNFFMCDMFFAGHMDILDSIPKLLTKYE
jgi:hypothetical protein